MWAGEGVASCTVGVVDGVQCTFPPTDRRLGLLTHSVFNRNRDGRDIHYSERKGANRGDDMQIILRYGPII